MHGHDEDRDTEVATFLSEQQMQPRLAFHCRGGRGEGEAGGSPSPSFHCYQRRTTAWGSYKEEVELGSRFWSQVEGHVWSRLLAGRDNEISVRGFLPWAQYRSVPGITHEPVMLLTAPPGQPTHEGRA